MPTYNRLYWLRPLVWALGAGALVAALAIAAWAPEVQGQATQGPRLINQSYQSNFPTSLVFVAEAEGPETIQSVTLYYGVKGAKSRAYAYPQFTAGSRVQATYTLRNNTQQTYIPPWADVTYYWVFEDSAGGRLETPEAIATFEDVRFTWQKLSQGQVTLYWYRGSESSARALLERSVDTLERIASEAGITFEGDVKVLLYNNKQDMDPALPLRSATYTAQTVTLGVALGGDTVAVLREQADLKETLTHELTHLVTGQLAEGPFFDMPVWLNEGLSMVAEEELSAQYSLELRRAAQAGRLITVRSMSAMPGDPNQVNLFYAQAHSLVDYLMRTYGREKFQELFRVLKDGNRFNDALKQVYGLDIDGLDAAWRAYLGAGPAPAPQPSPAPATTPQPPAPPDRTSPQAPPERSVPLALVAGLAVVGVLALGLAGVLAWALRRR
ncbi:MAG: hypothetical protein HYY01_01045 [Chloroflexi bacterium]|nr:hypothetical protein [Chloroflexota bacterium]